MRIGDKKPDGAVYMLHRDTARDAVTERNSGDPVNSFVKPLIRELSLSEVPLTYLILNVSCEKYCNSIKFATENSIIAFPSSRS